VYVLVCVSFSSESLSQCVPVPQLTLCFNSRQQANQENVKEKQPGGWGVGAGMGRELTVQLTAQTHK